jgi:hypothetical protein
MSATWSYYSLFAEAALLTTREDEESRVSWRERRRERERRRREMEGQSK